MWSFIVPVLAIAGWLYGTHRLGRRVAISRERVHKRRKVRKELRENAKKIPATEKLLPRGVTG